MTPLIALVGVVALCCAVVWDRRRNMAGGRSRKPIRMAARVEGDDWIVFEDVNGAMTILARQLRDAPSGSLTRGVVMDLSASCDEYLAKGVG